MSKHKSQLQQSLPIDVSETFPVLEHAPIVEAVLEVRTRGESELEEETASREIASRFPSYTVKPQRTLHVQLSIEGQSQHDRWEGFRATDQDNLHIAQFLRDRFVFSRLAPYLDWQQFHHEATQWWQLYRELVKPVDILRLGVRFINRINAVDESLSDVLKCPPSPPGNLPVTVSSFMHRDTFSVPGHDYTVQRIQTIQPPQPPSTPVAGILVDIDVATSLPFPFTEPKLLNKLAEMRWLKDKVFFGTLTKKSLLQFNKKSRKRR